MLFTKKFFLLEGRCGNQLLKETKEPVSSQVRQHDKSPHTDTGPDGCGSLRGWAAAPGSVLGGETGWQGSACVPSRGPSRPGGTGDDSREPLGDDAAVRSRNCHWPGAATPSPLSNGPAPRACASAPSPRRRPPPSPGDGRAAAGQTDPDEAWWDTAQTCHRGPHRHSRWQWQGALGTDSLAQE